VARLLVGLGFARDALLCSCASARAPIPLSTRAPPCWSIRTVLLF